MADSTMQELLSRLAGRGGENAATESWAAVEATTPDYDRVKSDAVAQVERKRQEKLDQLLGRIARLTGQGSADEATAPSATLSPGDSNDFFPEEPVSFRAAGLAESEVESLILKFLLARGDATGREISDQIKLPFVLIEELLRQMKQEQLVVHRGAAAMNDYQFQLTDMGRERARRYSEHCTYFGAAPVALPDYIASVEAQSLTKQHPTVDRFAPGVRRFADQSENDGSAWTGDQFRPRLVPVRRAGQRQDEHRRARDQGVRAIHLDSAGDRRRRRNHPPVRPQQPRGSAAGKHRRPARQPQNRQALGSHPPADDRRRRRTDDGQPGSDAATPPPASAKRRCN